MVDEGTLEDVLSHIHNWFIRETFTVRDCEISNGELPESVSARLLDGQWYRIEGSYLNDGVHNHPSDSLADERFDATISLLAIPRGLLTVAERISSWVADTEEADSAARRAKYKSESFGGYTYTLKEDSRSGSGSNGLKGWQAAFSSDLNPWRKIG